MKATSVSQVLSERITKVLEEADDEIGIGAEMMQAILNWVIDCSVPSELALLMVDKKLVVDLWEDLVYPTLMMVEERIAELDEEERA